MSSRSIRGGGFREELGVGCFDEGWSGSFFGEVRGEVAFGEVWGVGSFGE